jgi:DNA-binding MarR family transcriptional regulator
LEKYALVKDVLDLVAAFEDQNNNLFPLNLEGFKQWIVQQEKEKGQIEIKIDWEGKDKGRSPESVISTHLVHMSKYAKIYSKAAIQDSKFSSQEDFIYLITLKAFGEMTKIELIKRNIQDKPTGMQIINRLIGLGWAEQKESITDKRSKIISITDEGAKALEAQMDKIRIATRMVTGNLTEAEKLELIRLLDKLEQFHHPIFLEHTGQNDLLEKVQHKLNENKNPNE